MKIFTVNAGSVTPGAEVVEFKLNNGTPIAAVVIGEDGRGRKLGVLPVKKANPGDKIFSCTVGQSTTGRPVITAGDNGDDSECLIVMRSPIGYRGGNAHTGDRQPEYFGLDTVPGGASGFYPWPGKNLVDGEIAQGGAGNAGSGSQYIAVMPKNVVFRLNISGRLYGSPSSYYYRFDGNTVTALTWEDRVAADAWMPQIEPKAPLPPATIAGVLELAAKLPSGLNDDRAADKLLAERDELLHDLLVADRTGALTEAADAVYYVCKHLDWVANQVHVSVDDLFKLAIAKYALRAAPGNPKNDTAEREAVRGLGL